MNKNIFTSFFVALLLQALSPFSVSAETEDKYDKIYNDCVKKSGTINNTVVSLCSSQVSESINKEMSNLYDTIYQKISKIAPQDAQKFENAHKSWLQYRDSHCALMASYVGSPMYSYCPMELNKKRIQEMKELAR